MRAKQKKLMAMSKAPDGKIFVTQDDLSPEIAGSDPSIWRCYSDAVATEIVPQTEEAYADFIARHGGRPLHPTLAAYPNTIG